MLHIITVSYKSFMYTLFSQNTPIQYVHVIWGKVATCICNLTQNNSKDICIKHNYMNTTLYITSTNRQHGSTKMQYTTRIYHCSISTDWHLASQIIYIRSIFCLHNECQV